MRLTFHGGAGSVTGANYLLESGDTRILIDCGMQQGSRESEKANQEAFPYSPSSIHALFITHPHIDHVGRIPKLVKDGFRGAVHSTPPTKDLAELLLLDSERILRKNAEHDGGEPLYDLKDVHAALNHWHTNPYHAPVVVGPFTVTFFDAGHVLGSAIIKIECEGKTIVFSGDLGNYPAPIIRTTEKLDEADYCVIESTYGDRFHGDTGERRGMLEDAIEDVVNRGGVLLIPAFAMERTQDILYHMNGLVEAGRIPRIPVFVDSPLAIRLTEVYRHYSNYFNPETKEQIRKGDDILRFPGLRFTETTEESKEINSVPGPKIIVAGSGMSEAGRILFHEMHYLSDPKNMILFVGYQAAGTLGRRILEGAEKVKIMGKEIVVRCERRSLPGFSAHADQPRLLEWLSPMRHSLKKIFVVQGEQGASTTFAKKVRDELAVNAIVPNPHDVVEL